MDQTRSEDRFSVRPPRPAPWANASENSLRRDSMLNGLNHFAPTGLRESSSRLLEVPRKLSGACGRLPGDLQEDHRNISEMDLRIAAGAIGTGVTLGPFARASCFISAAARRPVCWHSLRKGPAPTGWLLNVTRPLCIVPGQASGAAFGSVQRLWPNFLGRPHNR